MVIFSILFLLLSNAVTLRRDKSILFSRVAITVLLYSSLIAFYSLYFCLDSGIGLYGGLFHATTTTHVFHIFIFLISAAILQLTAFYPRKVNYQIYFGYIPRIITSMDNRGSKSNYMFVKEQRVDGS
ncbi:putative nadh-ubiquinone oxidoreductase chain [Botrytis fragariae]|uniref:Putative nadh-ubiquinone oxidoreductase chain n=1 Tax=Botrytis fragariae TaxID=1964551 RepID=A0A8H6AJE8_9HELO|nr:putative nadh-ubiquinone oxidoreductase chain [Botrytis fragariae]KAF5868400.1 putative nadh-ubiquinone oxidoreductase chain [Botrytis fragariae]